MDRNAEWRVMKKLMAADMKKKSRKKTEHDKHTESLSLYYGHWACLHTECCHRIQATRTFSFFWTHIFKAAVNIAVYAVHAFFFITLRYPVISKAWFYINDNRETHTKNPYANSSLWFPACHFYHIFFFGSCLVYTIFTLFNCIQLPFVHDVFFLHFLFSWTISFISWWIFSSPHLRNSSIC